MAKKIRRVALREHRTLLSDLFCVLRKADRSAVEFEVSIGLPIGTVKKWISKIHTGEHLEPEDAALIKIVNTFPWVMDVARDGFDEVKSRGHLLRSVAELMINGDIK